MILAVVLVLLHAPSGEVIVINPQQVTSLRASREERGGHFPESAKCLVNTTDGKFVAVVEDCDVVRNLLSGEKR